MDPFSLLAYFLDRILADLVVHLIQQTALDLLLRPLGPGDAQLAAQPLPAPMFPGGGRGALQQGGRPLCGSDAL